MQCNPLCIVCMLFYYNNCIQIMNLMVLDPKKRYQKECRRMRKEILQEGRFFVFSRYTGLEEKCAVLCLLFGEAWYRMMWKAYLRLTKKDSGTMGS